MDAILEYERYERRIEDADNRSGLVCFSDLVITIAGEIHDGWDMIFHGEIAFRSSQYSEPIALTSAFVNRDYNDDLEDGRTIFMYEVIERLIASASLTDGESHAIEIYLELLYDKRKPTHREIAARLSEGEGKAVTVAASRRRISDAFSKLRSSARSMFTSPGGPFGPGLIPSA